MEKRNDQSFPKRDGQTRSIWQGSINPENNYRADPAAETIYDALIIGGGITGITTALLLQLAGKRCALVEANNIGFGTTGGTTAHLNTFFDATYPQIERNFGEAAAKQVAAAGLRAVGMINELAERFSIDCDLEYKDAYLFSENEKQTKELEAIITASIRAGIAVTEAQDNGVPLPFERAIRFSGQGQFHPLKYLYSLAKKFKAAGGTLLEHTFIEQTDSDDGIHTAISGDRRLRAKNVVYATHIPPGLNVLDFTCAPYRSYAIGLKLANNEYPTALVYDMEEFYHYFRTHRINGQQYLILGGEDHKTGHGDPQVSFEKLEAYARQYFDVAAVDYRWSAQYYISADGLPYIGHLPGAKAGVFVATGYGGNGMIFGTLAAQLISDMILGVTNPYAELFNPSRIKPIAGFSAFVKENADVAYHFVADRFAVNEMASLAELKPNQATVTEYGDQKLAVYRDAHGQLHALNPVCTHAGCTVKFNAMEKSWDCPCHGGRYDIDGNVLTGPPTKGLESLKFERK